MHATDPGQEPLSEREDRRDETYALVAELLGLPMAQRLSQHAPATRLVKCPSCGEGIRVADLAPIRAVLRERLAGTVDGAGGDVSRTKS